MTTNQASYPEDLDTDVIIIGGGAAGLAAAVAAAEKEVKVTLLEKRHILGGNTVYAKGFFAAESPVQRRMLIDAGRDELFRAAMDFSHWSINPRIIRAFVDKSGDTVRWLEDMGLIVDRILPFYPNQAPLVWHCPRGGGRAIIKVLSQRSQELGVKLQRSTAANRLLRDQTGRITGVLAKTEEEELAVKARSVVIASGGYGGNRELLEKYCPSYHENLQYFGAQHNTGDGLLMALDIGVASEGLGILLSGGPRFVGVRYLTAVGEEASTIWVNKRGERFVDESLSFHFTEAWNAVDRQPDKLCYSLFDERIKQSLAENGPVSIRSGILVYQKSTLPDLEHLIQANIEKGTVIVSDSWNDIATWMGSNPAVLKATIDEYNSFCDRGHDTVFSKERKYLQRLCTPPYYAMRLCTSFLTTIGGIKINHHMEALDHQENPVPGLYAAGDTTGGWMSETYCHILTGHAAGFALNSGRIAGENAATHPSDN